ncbi:hypothetical protein [Erythrobacter sp. JK5]|uniref:hypothetical protein n=1 Tax=Erythrobacter sp. JK5 TaxID=2829500 RepID=UPI001BAA5FEB|nr:hypothetical protein [Erythrobacter sp. JK5]QUL38631.1 hypothetical protein KDC96_04375 [Erythrobacter sp. JK5]
MRTLPAFVILASMVSVPASACISATPTVEAWGRCAYQVAYKTSDHRFMLSMADAVKRGKKLKPASMPRWREIESRIVARCGAYEDVAKVDSKIFADETQMFVPKDQFEAIRNTYEIDRLVKADA